MIDLPTGLEEQQLFISAKDKFCNNFEMLKGLSDLIQTMSTTDIESFILKAPAGKNAAWDDYKKMKDEQLVSSFTEYAMYIANKRTEIIEQDLLLKKIS